MLDKIDQLTGLRGETYERKLVGYLECMLAPDLEFGEAYEELGIYDLEEYEYEGENKLVSNFI